MAKQAVVTISPHPAGPDAVLTIEYPGVSKFDLEIVNLQGQSLKKIQLGNREPLRLGDLSLDSGMYIYQVSRMGETLRTGKMVLQ